MSDSGSTPEPGEAQPPAASSSRSEPEATPAPEDAGPPKDPLRGSRASGVWIAVVSLVVLLVLLSVFILQNTRSVEIAYLGWEGQAPLAAALLIAVAAGLLVAVVAGSLRILQLRRRVRREQKR